MRDNIHSLEHTALIESQNAVWHYTCNPPKEKYLLEEQIQMIGDQYNCDGPSSVLLIPTTTFRNYGFEPSKDKEALKIQSEQLLRKIGENYK